MPSNQAIPLTLGVEEEFQLLCPETLALEPAYDRLHALCHRIEGDVGNAGYWYRRAGVGAFSGSFAEEKQALESDLCNKATNKKQS